MNQLRLVALVAALHLVPVALATAQGNGARKMQKAANGSVQHANPAPAGRVEVRIIHDYYAARGYRPRPLPPGVAKNLARGKQIPPGLRRSRLPDELLVQLPPHRGHEWILADDVVLLVDVKGVIQDVLRNVF
jgi:Ni/Co efflux regulator RcnB